jgi:type IV pilus assembly protein PilZ
MSLPARAAPLAPFPSEGPVHEKRAHPRVPIDVTVRCEINDGPALTGVAKDISLGGMFIESSETPPFGSQVTIVGRFPSGELRLPGAVRWNKPGGFGVQFGLLGAKETHAIAKMLAVK